MTPTRHESCPCRSAPTREQAMVVLRRDASGRPTVWCDPCIAPIVSALNDAGLTTIASCCGHGQRPGVITLADERHLMIVDEAERVQIDRLFPRDVNGIERGGLERRQADLTSEEREALEWVRHQCKRAEHGHPTYKTKTALAVLDRLLARPMTIDEVKAALDEGGKVRKAAEKTLKRSPRR